MSGECEECGEHCLNDKCDKFFVYGKFFKTEEEFWKYSDEWPEMQITEESFDWVIELLRKDIKLNLFLRIMEMKNKEMTFLLEQLFKFFIHLLNKE